MLVKGKELFQVILPELLPAYLEGQRAPDKGERPYLARFREQVPCGLKMAPSYIPRPEIA